MEPDLNEAAKILQYVAGDIELREKLISEADYEMFIYARYGDKDEKLAEKEEILAEKNEQLAEKNEQLAEKNEQIAEKDQIIIELAKELKALGLSTESIIRKTGLSKEIIETL
jgi:hypothetical protein